MFIGSETRSVCRFVWEQAASLLSRQLAANHESFGTIPIRAAAKVHSAQRPKLQASCVRSGGLRGRAFTLLEIMLACLFSE